MRIREFLLLVAVFRDVQGAAMYSSRRICTNFAISNTVDNAEAPEPDTMYDEEDEDSQLPSDRQLHGFNYTVDSDSVLCERDVNFCYALWSFDASGNVSFVRQGCWEISDKPPTCEDSDCVTEYNPKLKEKFLFCCCKGNMCNSQVTGKEIADNPMKNDTAEVIHAFSSILLLTDPVVWSCLAIVFIILLGVFILLVCRSSKSFKSEMAPLAPSGPGYSSNLHSVDNLKLCSMLGHGKYGTVWKGIVNEQNVAVKIFPAHHKQYFLNEKDIYTLSMMEDKTLLRYFGCDERRTIEDNIEYLLVLSLAPLGCLQDWLKETTTSFSTFCQMAASVAHGVAYLHTELRKGDKVKPCICHRDLNSRNILVNADLTCCICDFGFAMKTFGPRYEYRGEIALAETKSIIEVGTLRYMAPEVLEGAVNLRDCESALKQIDVYSLGLVLWELGSRCHDFYANGKDMVPDYKAPYEAEIGKHPSYEQMQILVSRQKIRPQFSGQWGCGTASRIIRETCEDCWDHDAEARLTALCVEERLQDILQFKSRYSQNEDIKRSSPYLNGQSVNLKNISPVCNTNETIIITPPNQMISLSNGNNSPQQTKFFQGKTYAQAFVNPKISVRNAKEQKQSSAKISIGKIKRNKLDRKLQNVRSIIQKKIFKRIKLESDEFSSSISETKEKIQPNAKETAPPQASPKVVKRPNNLDIKPQRYYRPSERIETSNSSHKMATKTIPLQRPIQSSRMEKKITNSRLSLHQPQEICQATVRPRIVISKSDVMLGEDQCDGVSKSETLLKRQRSLEVFREVFGTQKSTERLRDPSQRVKTPGDVPPSVRKVRATKTLSLYDDRMMSGMTTL